MGSYSNSIYHDIKLLTVFIVKKLRKINDLIVLGDSIHSLFK